MEKETFQIYEWRIENFSSWNHDVHGRLIKSPQFDRRDYFQRMELYPMGSYCGARTMGINYFVAKTLPTEGNLSIIGADGSLLSTTRTCTLIREYYFCPKGLNFETIVAKFKNKKAQYEDRLTIRICFLSKEGHVDTVSTTLDVMKISLKLDTKLIESIKLHEYRNISIIHYNKKNYLDELLLKATRKGETIEFILDLLTKSVQGVFVESLWSLHKSDNTLIRNEEKVFLYRDCEPWTFSNSLKMNELVEKRITLLLSLKITNGIFIEKNLNSSQDISIDPKKTVCFFDQNSSKNIDDSVTANKTGDSVSALAKDFMYLYKGQKFSDLELKCGDVSFPVHRAILSARSPVFECMLSSDMREAASGTVDIPDLDAPTLSRFLTFVYTGALEDLKGESALKLYYTADKYQVPTLKTECSSFLCANVTLLNVCDILSLAYKHQDDELKSAVHNFVLENYNEVLASEKWRNFVKMEPLLAAETLTDFAAKSCVGKIRSQ